MFDTSFSSHHKFPIDFSHCPEIENEQRVHSLKFFVSGLYNLNREKNELLLSSTIIEHKGKSYRNEYLATFKFKGRSAERVSFILDLIQEYISSRSQFGQLPLLVYGDFRFDKKMKTLMGDARPLIPIKIEGFDIAFQHFLYSDIISQKDKIIDELKRYNNS